MLKMDGKPRTKIIKGYYLTGIGQEANLYYFKIDDSHEEFEQIEPGQVCLTFYQSAKVMTPLPAVIRVDSVITSDKGVRYFLREEKRQHYPLMPILGIYSEFDSLDFENILRSYHHLESDIHRLAQVTRVQGTLFDFMEGED
ncbi:MAG: hypothetical protein D8H99_07010 [Streptococcus sp.]|nr:MAG: hypothetical protein D8H99_07010 [Streptococcus sp.]